MFKLLKIKSLFDLGHIEHLIRNIWSRLSRSLLASAPPPPKITGQTLHLSFLLVPSFSVVLCETLLKCLLKQDFLLPRDLFLLQASLKFLIHHGLFDLYLFFLFNDSVEVDLILVINHAPVILCVFLFDDL
jgi:hypothetical protein